MNVLITYLTHANWHHVRMWRGIHIIKPTHSKYVKETNKNEKDICPHS